jgi:predicted AlkP superfamily pyrophosphatase or phosphodiesterase
MLSKKLKALTAVTAISSMCLSLLGNMSAKAEEAPMLKSPASIQNVSLSENGKTPVKRTLLISVDGLHAADLANYVKANPKSNLAALSDRGVTYSHASTTKPSDSFPGILSLVTGGMPKSTGVYYDNSYDRKLLPPVASSAGDKPGTQVLFDETIDKDMNAIDGGGGINPDMLPRDPVTKKPVYPHDFLKVNTIFEVVKAAGKHTAWSDKHLAYDLLNGPSGKGVEDLYTPEIAANGDATKSISTTEANDDLKVKAIQNEIDGKNHDGTASAPVPALFGMNFQAVSVAQKLPGNGYMDANGTFSKGLAEALQHTDQSIGQIVSELKKQNLFDSTMIIITAKHGQAPMDPSRLKITNEAAITEGVPSGTIAQMTTDDVALIWLTDSSKKDAVLAQIEKNKDKANIKEVNSYSAGSSKWLFTDPSKDSRTPDLVVIPNDGVIYTKPGKKIAEHGGFSQDDTNVAMLVAGAGMKKAQIRPEAVQTTQVAPTILQVLGLNPNSLQAVQQEHTQVLPGLPFKDSKEDGGSDGEQNDDQENQQD